MRSDNGPPFASRATGGLSRLAVRRIKAGVMCISLDLIGQLSDLGGASPRSDRSAQPAANAGWLC
jgi:hypothetical protein